MRYTLGMRTLFHKHTPTRLGEPRQVLLPVPSMWLCSVLLMSPIVGCDPCHSWDALAIDVAEAENPDEALKQIEGAVEQFIDWTQREETCVQEVQVRQTLSDGVGGRYFTEKRFIRVRDFPSAKTTVHEFCHAVDHEEGWISESGADALGQYTSAYEGNPHYPTEKSRIHEVFAQFCDDGPQVVELLEELNDICGLEANLDAARFVRDVVYPESEGENTFDWLAPHFSFESGSFSVDGTRREAGARSTIAVHGEAGTFVYDQTIVPNWDEVEDYVEPRILLLDTGTGELLDQLELDAHGAFEVDGNISHQKHVLFGSSSSPIFAAIAGENAGQVWRVETAPLRLENAGLPDVGLDVFSQGFEHDGKLMLHSRSIGPVQLVDLESGESQLVAGGEDTIFHADSAEALFVSEDGAVGAFYAPTGLAVVGLDWTGSWTWVRDIPLPTNRVQSLVGLADGSVVVTPVVYTGQTVGGSGYSPPITLWLQPVEDEWSIPADDCAAITGDGWLLWGDQLQRVGATEVEGEEGVWELQVVQLSMENEQG